MTTAIDPRDVELTGPDGELVARFATGAGMVGCSLRHRGEELLGLGEGLPAYVERGAVFGIPLLYPWANRLGDWGYEVAGRRVELDRSSPLLHAEENGLPIHGALAARTDWRVTGGDDRLAAELDFGAHPDLLAVFPFPHTLALDIRLGRRELRVDTVVTAGRESPVPLSFGFHPYLSPPGDDRERWWVELPARAELELDERKLPTGVVTQRAAEGFALGTRTFDDLFAVPAGPTRFAVSDGRRHLVVELASGYLYAQIYAPLDQPVICFEPMTAPINALRSHDGLRLVPPGGTAAAAFTLAVEEL
jgi:aldose 1-epimerase